MKPSPGSKSGGIAEEIFLASGICSNPFPRVAIAASSFPAAVICARKCRKLFPLQPVFSAILFPGRQLQYPPYPVACSMPLTRSLSFKSFTYLVGISGFFADLPVLSCTSNIYKRVHGFRVERGIVALIPQLVGVNMCFNNFTDKMIG